MSEIEDRLRALFEEISEPVDIDAVVATTPTQRWRQGWVIAAVAATTVLLIGVVPLLVMRSGDDIAITTSAPTKTTAVPSATTVVTTPSTTVPAAATNDLAPAAITGPVVIADSAERIGVQTSGQPVPFTLNPFLAGDSWTLTRDLDPLLFGGAWELGPDGEPVADLVESIPAPADGTAVRDTDSALILAYRIRDDARWSDGTPITSADFAMTLDLLHDEGLSIRSDWRAWHSEVGDFEAISETEFRVTMHLPLTRYRHLFPVVVPAHVVDPATFTDDWNESLWPSAGSMRLVSFERFVAPLAGAMTLEPNAEAPTVSQISEGLRIDFYQRDERGDSFAVPAFLDHRSDLLASSAFSPLDVDRFDADAAIAAAPAQIWEVLFLQPGPRRLEVNPESQLDDPAVRSTLIAGLLTEAGTLPGRRITSLVEYFVPGSSNPQGGWSAFSVLLTPPQPIPLVYESTDGETTMRIGRAIKPRLEAVGFDVELRFDPDASGAFNRFFQGEFEAFAIRLSRTPGSIGLFDLFEILTVDDFPNVWPDDASREAFMGALDRFADELDPAARLQHLIDAEQALVDAMTIVPLVTRESEAWAYHPDRIIGPTDYPIAGAFLAELTDWDRP